MTWEVGYLPEFCLRHVFWSVESRRGSECLSVLMAPLKSAGLCVKSVASIDSQSGSRTLGMSRKAALWYDAVHPLWERLYHLKTILRLNWMCWAKIQIWRTPARGRSKQMRGQGTRADFYLLVLCEDYTILSNLYTCQWWPSVSCGPRLGSAKALYLRKPPGRKGGVVIVTVSSIQALSCFILRYTFLWKLYP